MSSLVIKNNTLSGSIPGTLGQLPRLATLVLDDNPLSGPIPLSIFNVSSLIQFYAKSNNLSGTLPSNDSTFSLPRLQIFTVEDNYLTGMIPLNFASCTDLQVLGFTNNELHGTIPAELGNLPHLRYLILDENYLTGTIPPSLGNITKLTNLGFGFNKLEGKIPETLGNLVNLEQLGLGPNSLTGSIPTALLNASRLNWLELSINNLTGPVPMMIGKSLPLLTFLNMENMQLTGGLEFLSYLSNCRTLQSFSVRGNRLIDALPNSIANLSTNLQKLDLSGNLIGGEIPEGIGNLSGLFLLNLADNNLIGEIPSTIGRLQSLQGIGLYKNRIAGPIPLEICLLTKLIALLFDGNALSGSIPSCIGNISMLQQLAISGNRLSSGIPEGVWTLSSLLDLHLYRNTLEGSIPKQVGNLKSLNTFILSGNRLSGNLTNALGELQMLTHLDLSSNMLYGQLPESIGGLLNIVYINLSYNSLTGAIPKSLGNLHYLNSLDLSFNKLIGKVPQGRVFADLNISSLQGNEGLCGASQLGFPPCSSSISSDRKGRDFPKYTVLAIASSVVFLSACFCLLFTVLRWRKVDTPVQNDIQQVDYYITVPYRELVRATNNFSEANLLGRGSFGSVFKGCLDDGSLIAVKVLNLEIEGALRSFDTECYALSMARHRNLIKIISTCSNMEFKALVLQFMPNGSLDKWLHSDNLYVNLIQMINIMLDVSSALEYLHHCHPHVIVHCDLKPSNVLLDEDMVAHLSDFGIAQLFLGNSKSMAAIGAQGTIGYIPPEFGSTGKVSRKGDVYSFGILLLEAFTRKKPTDDMFDANLNLRQWASEAYPSAVLEIVDSNLLRDDSVDDKQSDVHATTYQCLLSIIDLGLLCSKDSPEERIPMNEVVPRLQTIKAEYLSMVSRS